MTNELIKIKKQTVKLSGRNDMQVTHACKQDTPIQAVEWVRRNVSKYDLDECLAALCERWGQ